MGELSLPLFFMTLESYIEHLDKFDVWTIITPIIEKHLNEFEAANRDQLLEGKTVFGDDIRPYISEDDYFKTPEAATRYAAWKNRTNPNPLRKKDVPNLYINGTFHRSIQAIVDSSGIDFASSASFADSIEDKFKNILGVNIDSTRFDKLIKKIKPDIIKAIKNYILWN